MMLNTAKNIKNFALKNNLSETDRKNQGKLPTLVGALTLEAIPSTMLWMGSSLT